MRKMAEEIRVEKEDIKAGLSELGLKRRDFVGVHSSLSSFGYVEGGADTVVDALIETVGEEGGVIVPAYSNNRENVERTPEEVEMGVTWKSRVLPYEPEVNSCWTGKIPDTLWRREGAVRGPHPTHSLAAIGKNAEEMCLGWNRLLTAGGYILMLGVDLNCCSSMHLAEDQVEIPQRIVERTIFPPELKEKYSGPEWNVGFGPYPEFGKMGEICERAGIVRETTIGKARVTLFVLRELIDLYAEELRRDPDQFYTG